MENPGQSEFCEGDAMVRCDFVHGGEHVEATRFHVFLHAEAAGGALEVGFGAVLAGKESGGEGDLGHDAEIMLYAIALQRAFESGAGHERVFRLDCLILRKTVG